MGVRFPPFATSVRQCLPKEKTLYIKDNVPHFGNKLRRTVILFYGFLTVISIVWMYFRGHSNIFLYKNAALDTKPYLQSIGSILIGCALGLLLVCLTQILQVRFKSIRLLHNEFHHLITFTSKRDLFLLALFSSFGEELFFRGAILGEFLHWIPTRAGIALSVCISSFLFSLLHIAPGRKFYAWTISSFILGILLALLYLQLGDLWVVIALHFTVNWCNLRSITKQPVQV